MHLAMVGVSNHSSRIGRETVMPSPGPKIPPQRGTRLPMMHAAQLTARRDSATPTVNAPFVGSDRTPYLQYCIVIGYKRERCKWSGTDRPEGAKAKKCLRRPPSLRCVGDPDFLVIFHSDNFGRRCRLDRKYIKPIYKILREDIGVPVMKPLLERFLASADRPFLPLR